MALTVGSLFSGIGGIDLGLERAGMVTRWFVEIDPHCRNVLARHWPGVPVYGDITAIDWSGVEPVDVLAGGFPCQPVSAAGKRLGKDDERWLWPEFARAIRALRPQYVFVENVAALMERGFGEVITDLAAIGYDAEWDCIPAAAVGATHLRERIWIVAYPSSDGRARSGTGYAGLDDHPSRPVHLPAQSSRDGAGDHPMADSHGIRRGQVEQPVGGRTAGEGVDASPADSRIAAGRAGRRPESVLGGVFDGLPAGVDGHRWPAPPGPQYDWEPPRVLSVKDPHHVRRLKALGNAVVPQVVEWIGRRIVAFDEARAVSEVA